MEIKGKNNKIDKIDKYVKYDIDRENEGMKIIDDYNICKIIFKSDIQFYWERNSIEQCLYGWDLTLDNGTNIDVKSQVGLYENNKYYTKLVLSVRRKQNGVWKDCLTNKRTDIYLFPVQRTDRVIEFYYIERADAFYIAENFPLHKGLRGGKMQEYAVIDFTDSHVKKAKIYLDLRDKRVYRSELNLQFLKEVNREIFF